ncbi:aminoglycoside phosphotransferase family protein [Geomicrobium sp. JCM 19039]|uniref:aminoglycoside phosphotransferase family protein n=1 Tax=Geomicrobium sp. JCM 19039 TaxID=1460636 RepID=UPI00045F11A0|nr:aminoglycoside phosphotransferase family protein [Geomicrobium sp. JCM 19039]GAK11721.1 hypothetical protein JCM19039_1436 [Geomicrobium sp. JCM 19039]
MKSFKLNLTGEDAANIICDEHPDAVHIKRIDMGERSSVYQFETATAQYVAHFRPDSESIDKARQVYHKYGATLPIPVVHRTNVVNGIHYMFSERATGKPIVSYEKSTQGHILINLTLVYSKIANTKTNGKFGWIDPKGHAKLTSWPEVLESFFIEEADGFYGNWKTLFEDEILEREPFDQGFKKMMELASYAPKTSFLVHGDFHLGNMLSDGEKVTGIVDWEMAMQGDFMFDLAGLHFWSPEMNFPKMMKEIWKEQGIEIPHFKERLYANLLFKATDGLRFYAKQEHKEGYEYIKTKLYQLLNDV